MKLYSEDIFGPFSETLKSLKMTKKKLMALMSVATILLLGISFYFGLVPVTFHFSGFRALVVAVLLIWSLPLLFYKQLYGWSKKAKKSLWIIPLAIAIGFVVINTVVSIATAPVFMAKNYRELISVTDEHKFEEDVENTSRNLRAIIEPVALIFVGVVVGGMLIALYVPMLTSSTSIGS